MIWSATLLVSGQPVWQRQLSPTIPMDGRSPWGRFPESALAKTFLTVRNALHQSLGEQPHFIIPGLNLLVRLMDEKIQTEIVFDGHIRTCKVHNARVRSPRPLREPHRQLISVQTSGPLTKRMCHRNPVSAPAREMICQGFCKEFFQRSA